MKIFVFTESDKIFSFIGTHNSENSIDFGGGFFLHHMGGN
jgi:hypothetical protein